MKGVLLFAYNNGITDYFEMAVRTAKRVKQFLNLPVSVVTDLSTDIEKYENVLPLDLKPTEIYSPEIIEKLKEAFPKRWKQMVIVALAVLSNGKIDGYDGLDKQIYTKDIKTYTNINLQ